jgi:hypothetical protein
MPANSRSESGEEKAHDAPHAAAQVVFEPPDAALDVRHLGARDKRFLDFVEPAVYARLVAQDLGAPPAQLADRVDDLSGVA